MNVVIGLSKLTDGHISLILAFWTSWRRRPHDMHFSGVIGAFTYSPWQDFSPP